MTLKYLNFNIIGTIRYVNNEMWYGKVSEDMWELIKNNIELDVFFLIHEDILMKYKQELKRLL